MSSLQNVHFLPALLTFKHHIEFASGHQGTQLTWQEQTDILHQNEWNEIHATEQVYTMNNKLIHSQLWLSQYAYSHKTKSRTLIKCFNHVVFWMIWSLLHCSVIFSSSFLNNHNMSISHQQQFSEMSLHNYTVCYN